MKIEIAKVKFTFAVFATALMYVNGGVLKILHVDNNFAEKDAISKMLSTIDLNVFSKGLVKLTLSNNNSTSLEKLNVTTN